jgi:hypothetical protein
MVFEEDGDPFDYPDYFVKLNAVGIIFKNWKLCHLLKLNAIKLPLHVVKKIAEATIPNYWNGQK